MPQDPFTGFITRKEAAKLYNRNYKSLIEEDWKKAKQRGDRKTLNNFKLRRRTGDEVKGREVTTELIEWLRRKEGSPTWYIRQSYLDHKYDLRGESPKRETTPEKEESGGQVSEPKAPSGQVVSLLKGQIQKLEEDKRELRDELKIKNEQIQAANERNRETHVLMRDLHEVIRDLQKRLPAPETSSLPAGQSDSEPHDAVVVTESQEKGGRKSPKKKTARTRKRTAVTSKKQVKHKWYETPTLNRLLNRS